MGAGAGDGVGTGAGGSHWDTPVACIRCKNSQLDGRVAEEKNDGEVLCKC